MQKVTYEKTNLRFEKFRIDLENQHKDERKKHEKTQVILRKKNEELREKRKMILSQQTAF